MTKTSHPLRPNRRKTTAAFLVMGLTISIGADVVLPPPLNDNNSPAGAPGHPGGAKPSSPKADVEDARKGNVADAMHAFMKCGLTVKQAAGFTGEIYAESALGAYDQGRVLGRGSGDGGEASGVAQWHKKRWQEVIGWAASKGLNWQELRSQYEMVCFEAKHDYSEVLKAMDAAQSVVELERAAQPYEGNAAGPGRKVAIEGVHKALETVGEKIAKGPDPNPSQQGSRKRPPALAWPIACSTQIFLNATCRTNSDSHGADH
jgi:hypothetical protein